MLVKNPSNGNPKKTRERKGGILPVPKKKMKRFHQRTKNWKENPRRTAKLRSQGGAQVFLKVAINPIVTRSLAVQIIKLDICHLLGIESLHLDAKAFRLENDQSPLKDSPLGEDPRVKVAPLLQGKNPPPLRRRNARGPPIPHTGRVQGLVLLGNIGRITSPARTISLVTIISPATARVSLQIGAVWIGDLVNMRVLVARKVRLQGDVIALLPSSVVAGDPPVRRDVGLAATDP